MLCNDRISYPGACISDSSLISSISLDDLSCLERVVPKQLLIYPSWKAGVSQAPNLVPFVFHCVYNSSA